MASTRRLREGGAASERLAAAHAVSTKTAASLMARQWRLLGVSAFLRNAPSSDIAGNKRYAWLESRVKSLKCCTHARELLKTVAALRRDEKDDGKGCGVPAYASIGRARGTGVENPF